MPKVRVKKHVLLCICGDSAAGKTTISKGIADILGPDRCTIICTDDYHCFDRKERSENGISALNPKGNYLDVMAQHFRLLSHGQPILKPVYNHDNGKLERPHYIQPKEYVILEGLLGLSTKEMRQCHDVKIYLEPEEDLRIKWKIHRDMVKRGYTEAQVRASLEKRKSDSPEFIHPQRKFADIVVNFHRPSVNTHDFLDVKNILRPTLPHPHMHEPSADEGWSMTLGRDYDGKPADIMSISGGIKAETALQLEDELWQQLPEASHLRDNVGRYADPDGLVSMSHPLALTQLMIAYQLVKAAGGIHAL